MATPQAQDRVAVPNQAAVLQELMQLISGGGETRTTRTTGNISWLEQLLAQLQGADYERTLQSVFANAAENIPGLRQQLVHAAGARGGNNTAMEAALQRLLAATTVQAQGQLVEQQQRNQQIQQAARQQALQEAMKESQVNDLAELAQLYLNVILCHGGRVVLAHSRTCQWCGNDFTTNPTGCGQPVTIA